MVTLGTPKNPRSMAEANTANYVQNCDNSDLFGSNLNKEQDDQDKVHRSRTHNENNMTCDFPHIIQPRVLH